MATRNPDANLDGTTDFLLDPEDRVFRAGVRDLLARELAPRAAAIEADADWEDIKAVVRAVGSAGLLALMFGTLYRGPLESPGLVHATLLSEESAALSYAFETTIASGLSCAYALDRHAPQRLRERYLPGIVEGREIGAICVTEAEVGSDIARMSSQVEYDPAREEWVINGVKRYISNASVADTYVVYGRTSSELPAVRGISAILVPSDAPGLSFPRTYHLMGRRGCVVGEVELRDCRVPADHLLGERDRGFQIMLDMFNFERVLLGGAGLGVARSAFEIARQHAQARVAFGERLGAKQLIWSKIAEMSWRLDAAELLTYRAARLYDAREAPAKALMKAAAVAKLVASETANFCADAAVQILGGDGLTKEYGRAEQIYRDARALTIVGGSTEMVKYLIAVADLPELKPRL